MREKGEKKEKSGRLVDSSERGVERERESEKKNERSVKRRGRGRRKQDYLLSHFSSFFPFPFFRGRASPVALPFFPPLGALLCALPSFEPPFPKKTMRGLTSSLARAAALALLSAASLLATANAEQVTSLDRGPWTLSNGQSVSLPVSLPKYALEAMQDAGLVGDPLWR